MLKFAKTSLIAVSITVTSLCASDILVTVNGKNITKQDAEMFVNATAPNAHYSQLSKPQQDLIKERLIEKVLFMQLAQEEGIDKKPEFAMNMEKIKEELLVNMWMKSQMDNAVVSDSEAKEFYDKNTEKFIQEDSAHARHILLKTEKEAQAVIDELKNLKNDALKTKFIELAKTKSADPAGSNGGDLGTFTKEQMVPEFSKAVWELEVGKITMQPVKTQFGYHVIYLEEKSDAKPIPYEEVKDKIIISLKQQQFNNKITEVAKELKSKAKIVDMSNETNTTK
ncbi:MAG: peptidylprolyl isomerase [Sulfurovum sp.]|nr:peptidylprolyl isomerase [Sulfurovum sp.]MDD3602929.1 peptidylprolyl isomerase [Sulfurovum sp.]